MTIWYVNTCVIRKVYCVETDEAVIMHSLQICKCSARRASRVSVGITAILCWLVWLSGCFPPPYTGERPNSWIKTMDRLSERLYFYHTENGCVFPFDSRGPDYALYRLISSAGYDQSVMEEKWGIDYLPFRMAPKEEKVIDLRVDYLNPKSTTLELEVPPIVLLVRRFEEERPKSLLLIGSDLSVYNLSFVPGTEPEAEAAEYLGMSLIELSNRHPTKRIAGSEPPHPAVNITNRDQYPSRSKLTLPPE